MADYLLTEMQKGILFGSYYSHAMTHAYLNQVEIVFKETVRANCLKKAIQQVVDEFPTLKCHILPSHFKLIIDETVTVNLNEITIENAPISQQEKMKMWYTFLIH